MLVEITLAQQAHCLEIAEMSRRLIETGLRWRWKPSRILELIRHPECVVIIAVEVNPKIAVPVVLGFAAMEFHQLHGHLNLLAVNLDQREQGIGKQLLDWLELTAITAGLNRISLEVRSSNVDAIRFYEKANYQIDRIIKGYYQGIEDALQMTHELISRERAALQP